MAENNQSPPDAEKIAALGVHGENTPVPSGSSLASETPSRAASETATAPPSAQLGAVGAVPDVETKDETGGQPPEQRPQPPYCVFSKKMKIFIIIMSAISGLFSPMSSFIYLPALEKLSRFYHTSVADINFSVTTYMIMQGLAPMFFGDMADQIGRRPVYMLTLVIYLLANMGLALQSNYAALLVLRALQSTGSSGTIALGNAVMADIATAAERSGYIGYVQAGIMFGPALAPTIGGILTQFLGWRSIFWFLMIASGVYLIAYLTFLPETSRKIVGNGSIPPQGWNKSLIDIIRPRKHYSADSEAQPDGERPPGPSRVRFPNPLATLRIVVEKDVAIVMLFASIMVTGFYTIMVPISPVFANTYNFNQLQIGLCYIPFSIGSAAGSIVAGKFLDYNFKKVARKIGYPEERRRGDNLRTFPIEKARLEVIWIPTLIGACCITVWGWILQQKTNLSIPLIILFISGASISGAMTMQQTLLIDLYPQSPATVSAALNLCRCLISAGGTSAIQYIINGIGLGWSYTLVGLIVMSFIPTIFVLLKWSPKWREERFVRNENKNEQQQQQQQQQQQSK